MGLIQLLVMCTFLGSASFGLGLLPLVFTFSKTRIAQISTIGTGLLLGAAMGVVIPEGIEALHHASKTSSSPSSTPEEPDSVPTRTIALCLLSGFTLMLVIEQLLPASAHHQSPIQLGNSHARATLFEEDDIEQLELGPAPGDQYPDPTAEPDPAPRASMNRRSGSVDSIPIKRGFTLVDDSNANGKTKETNPGAITLGLVIHSIADGLALGASARSGQSSLEAIVFLAIIVHKAPTALALSTALMPHLSRQSVRRHITAFALTSPLSALMTYFAVDFLGEIDSLAKWTGIALLFSGGTFLYVATVLQPISSSAAGSGHHHHGEAELKPGVRVLLTVLGMFFPLLAGSVLGHGHEH
ncbi:hypothetical protein BDV93DRAFT_526110 [Ceratobasidium sp. AG-I]|nr:hypothetical protein BDV93DRAFT_526110 [Ceratobasidium sp. AG-I]